MNDSDLRGASSLATYVQVLHHGRLQRPYDRLFKYKQSTK